MKADEIIIRPILSEKSSLLREAKNKTYVFEVAKNSNKIEVLKAMKELFKVEALSCSIVNVRGKKKANIPYRGSVKRGHGKTASWKKAYVVLPEGKTIAELEA
ncbi:50S ribosomal protein L23 [Entomospira nematocerorum]|uniref:Large ribosomal subunit protein uL23 n=1 Tax=Entomospira nematocerorum TaxID=2719987 RepID=A0A968GCA1_9SPIO|nr:50S ribosomal protein L23 [Entomospira nematocera]NIZ47242.1 50S ribosomal protein L23 [Entomospira nematocera]WDI34216.1 50S ribosomal protein L23 [Entomospira nematocera]